MRRSGGFEVRRAAAAAAAWLVGAGALVGLTAAAIGGVAPTPAGAAASPQSRAANGTVVVSTSGTAGCAITDAGALRCAATDASGSANATTMAPVVGAEGPVTTATLGLSFTCILQAGAVSCKGSNSFGQLGDGTTTARTSFVPVLGLESGVVALATGMSASCAVMADGTVRCWGAGNELSMFTDLAGANVLTPRVVPGLAGITSIGLANGNGCAGSSAGAWCWGSVPGVASIASNAGSTRLPVTAVPGVGAVVDIDAGEGGACALLQTGAVSCWGDILGAASPGGYTWPTTIPELASGIRRLALGLDTACAIDLDGDLLCWGTSTDHPILGDGVGARTVLTPTLVTSVGGPVADVALGMVRSCAVRTDGELRCWGSASLGPLGTGDPWVGSATGVAATSGTSSVAAGTSHTCTIGTGGSVSCIGRSTRGSLGTTDLGATAVPRTVPGLSGITQLAAGTDFTCALSPTEGVRCWGTNADGELGLTTTDSASHPTPATVTGLSSGVTEIAAGGSTACALLTDQTVRCWGLGTSGQLGNGASSTSATPVSVSTIATATDISVGAAHACARLAAGSIRCWGANASGQLGNGTTTASNVPVTSVTSSATFVAAGGSHTCAVTSTSLPLNSGARCWGADGSGQLGNGAAGASTTPVVVTGASLGQQNLYGEISASARGTCLRRTAGFVTCWGAAPPTSATSDAPVSVGLGVHTLLQVPVGPAVASNATSYPRAQHCAAVSTGLLCWGDSSYGQAGREIFQTASPVAGGATYAVPPTNRAPEALGGSVALTRSTTKGFVLPASDPDGTVASVAVVDPPADGTLSCVQEACTYVAPATPGTRSFTYRVTDDAGATTDGAFTLEVRAPRVSAASLQVLEPDLTYTIANVAFQLDAPMASDVTVTYHTTDGTATAAGGDYRSWGTAASPRSVKIKAGTTWNTITVPVHPDVALEGDESFSVVVTAVEAADGSPVQIGDGVATVSIVDNYRPSSDPLLFVQQAEVEEGHSASSVARVPLVVQLSKPLATSLTVSWRTIDGSATGGPNDGTNDYRAATGTLTIPAGVTLKTADIPVWGDTVVEGDETVELEVTLPDGTPVVVYRSTAADTILDDDA